MGSRTFLKTPDPQAAASPAGSGRRAGRVWPGGHAERDDRLFGWAGEMEQSLSKEVLMDPEKDSNKMKRNDIL